MLPGKAFLFMSEFEKKLLRQMILSVPGVEYSLSYILHPTNRHPFHPVLHGISSIPIPPFPPFKPLKGTKHQLKGLSYKRTFICNTGQANSKFPYYDND